MTFVHDSYTAVGGRKNNEEALMISQRDSALLYVVADGLGGHESGELASEIAVNEIKGIFDAAPDDFDPIVAIQSANTKILKEQTKTGLKMKTTIVLAYVANDKIVFAHVGDSRAYAFKDKTIIYQSIDHSASQMAVSIGEITADQIRNHEDRNVLTRALGVAENIKVDVVSIPCSQVDAMILCTDGFWEYVYEEDMLKTLSSSKNPDVWLYKMREALCKNIPISNDNNTAITIMKRGKSENKT